jgi:hypothetical protein
MGPSWLPVVKAVVQPVVGALPALILVIFAGLLGLLALTCGEGRRRYALEYAEKFVGLASVVVGGRPNPSPTTRRAPVDRPQ